MQDKINDWVKNVLHKAIDMDGFYGCQSPDIVNHYARYMYEDDGFVGNAHDLVPHHNNWLLLSPRDIKVGDVAIYPANYFTPYGNCLVVTELKSHERMGTPVVRGICSVNGKADYFEYDMTALSKGYRHTKPIIDIIKTGVKHGII